MLRLVLLKGFQGDIDALPQTAKEAAVLMLKAILAGDERGAPLDRRAATADLADCRKVYFDPNPHVKPQYRIVVRFAPSMVEAVAVEAVAVGRREAMDAYVRAARNLGR